MRKTMQRILTAAFACTLLFAGCGKNIVTVDSGTYSGTITEVNPDAEEIYVDIGDERILELYFSDKTELMKDDQTVPFSQLKTGERVSVKVEREDDRLKPVEVNILD